VDQDRKDPAVGVVVGRQLKLGEDRPDVLADAGLR
jgi:hypothetical protein